MNPKTNLERRDISKWPARILATSRTIRVIGRIKFLISSIKKSKKVKGKGVPSGIKWYKDLFIELIKEKIIILDQILNEKKNMILTWEEKGKL